MYRLLIATLLLSLCVSVCGQDTLSPKPNPLIDDAYLHPIGFITYPLLYKRENELYVVDTNAVLSHLDFREYYR